MKVLIIIPAYNEEKNIVSVVNQLKAEKKDLDYVIVNDGSKDKTLHICLENSYNVINLPVNLGLSAAFQAGMKYAYKNHYDYAMQFDADGQHQSKYIETMVNTISKGSNIVIGSRFVEVKKPKTLRMIGNNLISIAIRLTTGVKINDPTSGMRIYDKKLIELYAKNINFDPEPDTLSYLIKEGIKVSEIQVEMQERLEGTSYLTFTHSVQYMVKMCISILLIQFFRKKI